MKATLMTKLTKAPQSPHQEFNDQRSAVSSDKFSLHFHVLEDSIAAAYYDSMDPADFSPYPFLDSSMRLDASAASSEEASPNSTFSEKDLALSGEAHRAFLDGNFAEATAALTALRRERAEDPAVGLNLAVAKFRSQNGGTKALAEAKEALEVIYRQVTDGSDFEEAEHAVLLYNLAVVYFLRRQFLKAHQLLVRLHAPSNSSSGGSLGEDISRSLLALLTALSLNVNLPNAALSYLAEQERKASTVRSPELILQRACAMVLLKQHKIFKRDLKSNSSFSAKETIAFEFYRANMEYLRGNHRKAQKLLTLSVQNGKPDKPDVCPNQLSFFQNNCGCISMMLSKPNLAAYYFTQALQTHCEAVKSPSMTGRIDFLLQIRKCEILYNLGLSLLHAGNPEKAFQVLQQAQPMMQANPHYWLHLAECCVVACCGRKHDNVRDLQNVDYPVNVKAAKQLQREPISVSFRCVGQQGSNQKIILSNLHEQRRAVRNPESSNTIHPALSLPFASACLVNASVLVRRRCETPGGPNQSQPCSAKSASVRAAILLNQCFVALCLDDHTQALKHSQELLALAGSGVPAGYFVLARLYAGEALVFLDRISEAISALDPKSVSDVSFSEGRDEENNVPPPPPATRRPGGSGGSSSSTANNQQQASELLATRAMFSFNLVVAYLMRGELDRADEMIDSLWASRHTHRLGARVFSAKLYVQLKRGNVRSCRDLIRQNCAVVSSTTSTMT